MIDPIRIVLVAPSGPLNVGSAARIMANMGLRDLVIVAPRCDVRGEEALGWSAHGRGVLERAGVVDDLPAALSDCVRTFATTSKLGLYRRQAAVTPAEAAREALELAGGGARVALVFGREDYGLKTRELLHVDRVVTIPADDAYPVLNLAGAVTVMCYELRKAAIDAGALAALPLAIRDKIATGEKKELLFERLFDAFDGVGYFFGQNPDHLKYALRHLFGRLDLTNIEADILLGLARQIRWYVDHHPRRTDSERPS